MRGPPGSTGGSRANSGRRRRRRARVRFKAGGAPRPSRSRAVRIPERRFPERLQDGPDQFRVADGGQYPGRRVEEFLGGQERLFSRHVVDAVPPRGPLVFGQSVEEPRALVLGNAARGLARNGKAAQKIFPRAVVLLGRRPLRGIGADQVEESGTGLARHLGSAVDRGPELPSRDARRNGRVGAVGEAALFPKDVEEARGRAPSERLVRDESRREARVPAGERGPREEQIRLHRAGPVHEVNRETGDGRRGRNGGGWRENAGGKAAEGALGCAEQRVGIRGAREDQRGVRERKARGREGGDVALAERREAFFRRREAPVW